MEPVIDYDKLRALDYTAYDHFSDFEKQLREEEIFYPEIEVEHHYDGTTPVVTVRADDAVNGKSHTGLYRLEGVTGEEFEEVMYDIWVDAMKGLEV